MLTSRGLAYWIMDDGYWDGSTVRLPTGNLSLQEVELLSHILFSNFGYASRSING